MPKKVELKTSKNEKNPREYIESIEKEQLKTDCLELLDLFEKVTGMEAKMWGDSIVGFGEYKYCETLRRLIEMCWVNSFKRA